jgi:lipopolysaccharide export system ATP-binding protein
MTGREEGADRSSLIAICRPQGRRNLEIGLRLFLNVSDRPFVQRLRVMPQLLCEGLEKSFRRKHVVNRVSLEIRGGEVVGLLGPNGAGKTTIFYMIVGLLQPNEGKIYLNDEEISSFPMYLRARRGIGYLPQEPSVFRKLSVEENLMAILETLPLSKKEKKERLEELLDELALSSLRKQKAYSLSGGERRRVEITRALVLSPSFILLDEPFAGIDPIAVLEIQSIVRKLKTKGIGIIITDHNVRETLGVCDRAYILNEGRILEEGSPENIARSHKARKIYLGDGFELFKDRSSDGPSREVME